MIPARTLDDWLAYIRTVHFRSIDMSLERVEAVLARMCENPPFRVVAVAGTNGKGSCAAMLASILGACGYRTGLYTSPHLVRFNERVQVNGKDAGDADLCRAFEHVESLRGEVPLTYFEFATLAAVRIYEQAGVDIAVMEVGMGGRLDAVNAMPIDASLITNIDLDHVHWLGGDRESIGREKAHIMRGGRASVFNHGDPPRSVLDHAAAVGTRLLVAERDYHWEATGAGWVWSGPHGETWDLEPPPIPGAVQFQNAAGVLALLTSCGFVDLDRESAARGLGGARVRGRCEIVAREPMVMIDVAHNLSAIETLKRHMNANPVPGKTTAVFGMLKDKDPAGAVRAMDELVDAWHLATIEDERGQEAEELAVVVGKLVRGSVHCHAGAAAAYDWALRHSTRDDRILGFGSFLIAGDILAHIMRSS